MLNDNHQQGSQWHPLLFYSSAAVILAADQLTKILVRSLLYLGQSIPKTGFFRITHVQNTGASFGILPDQGLLLKILPIIGIIIILLYAHYINKRYTLLNNRLGSVILGIILGGTAGNLVDRLRVGYVTDFIDIGPWPSFNVADSSVVVGTIIFAFILLISARTEKQ
jgi:signal peptidase II